MEEPHEIVLLRFIVENDPRIATFSDVESASGWFTWRRRTQPIPTGTVVAGFVSTEDAQNTEALVATLSARNYQKMPESEITYVASELCKHIRAVASNEAGWGNQQAEKHVRHVEYALQSTGQEGELTDYERAQRASGLQSR